jgi:hypothetical protein
MKDLTQYSEQELTLLVMNDEQLYKQASKLKVLFKKMTLLMSLKNSSYLQTNKNKSLDKI